MKTSNWQKARAGDEHWLDIALHYRDWRGGILSALDFAETRSQDDARLLTSARGKKKGERMTDDEAKALRRKVGGTASKSFCMPHTLISSDQTEPFCG